MLDLCVPKAWSRVLYDHENEMKEQNAMWMARFVRVYKDNTEKEKKFNVFKEI